MLARPLSPQQWALFSVIFAGYTLYVWCRKIVVFLSPELTQVGGLRKDDVGFIITSFVGAYVASRFFMGILSDYVDSKILFSMGLLLSALCLTCASFVNSVSILAGLWLVSGLAQGCGWPACSNLLRRHFEPSNFGTLWSWLACSVNVTGAVGPVLLRLMLGVFGDWRRVMFVSGIFCAAAAFIVLMVLQLSADMVQENCAKPSPQFELSKYVSVLKDAYYQRLAMFYFIVFSTRTFFENWTQLLLIETRGMSSARVAWFVSTFEIGGLVSGFGTGYASDVLAIRQGIEDPCRSRSRLALFYMLVAVFCLSAMSISGELTIIVVAFFLGASLYGCVNIFGINASEMAPSEIAGFCHSVVSLIGTVGALLSGYPTALVAGSFGWSVLLVTHTVLCAFCLICMACTRNLSTTAVLAKAD